MNKSILIMLALAFTFPIYSATPVVDYAAISKIVVMIEELEQQYDQMKESFKEAQIQTDFLSEQLVSMTGQNPFGNLYNSAADKQMRIWAPDSIEAFEEMLEHGFNPGDLDDRYSYYQEQFPSIKPETIDSKNPHSVHRDLYVYNEEWTKLNLAGFAQTFDAVNASYEKINNLLAEVNHHETLKESSDFSNRLLGELAYLMQGMIQIKNFDLHINAMLQQAEQNHIAAHTQFFTFKRK